MRKALLFLSLCSLLAANQHSDWNRPGGARWQDSGNWKPKHIPDGATDGAILGPVIENPSTVQITKNVAVGLIRFDSPNSYTIDGGQLIFDKSTIIEAVQGKHYISAKISGDGGFTKNGPGALSISGQGGANTYTGDTVINDGVLELDKKPGRHAISGDLKINRGSVLFKMGDQVSSSSTVFLDGGTLDLGGFEMTAGMLIFNYGQLQQGKGPIILPRKGKVLQLGNGAKIKGPIKFKGKDPILVSNGENPFISGPIDLGGNSLTFDITGQLDISGAINNGSVTKMGGGTLVLSGQNTYTGSTTVKQGLLRLDQDVLGPVIVESGAKLEGYAILGNGLKVLGTLQPGGSIGTMTVSGDVVQASGSTLEIELNSTSNDLLDIQGGSYTIEPGATLKLVPYPGTYSRSFTTTFVQTTDGVFGTFENVFSTSPFLTFQVDYSNPLLVQLVFQASPFSYEIMGGNPGAVAKNLDKIELSNDLSNLLGQLVATNSIETIRDAFNQMHPAALNAFALAQEQSSIAIGDAISGRLTRLSQTLCCCPCAPQCACSIWGTVIGDFGWQDSQGELQGYKADNGAVVIGADRPFRNARLGWFGAYSHSNIDWHRKGNGDIDSFYTGGYGIYQCKRLYLLGSLYGAYNRYEANRKIQYLDVNRTAKSTHSGGELGSLVELGTQICCAPLTIQPFANLQYLSLWEGAYSEHGADALNLNVRSKDSDLLRTELGMRFYTCVCNWSPYLQLGWVHHERFRGRTQTAMFTGTSTPFTVYGFNTDRSLFLIATGISTCLCDGKLLFSVGYHAEIAGHYNVQRAHLTLLRHF